ncbi:SDR family oxidoreductase [Virgibacillus sp. C22-A2]|uniref:SDR family oxidoreductase n=1 Tax=Virgibacillus tibetensis TaxID=3042313 RepID=A0ABU6KGV8_9BACI|nr:SDR family oxidoreductase [Virgibacillus sp. C22-A2]
MFPIHDNLNGKVVVITGGSGVLCSAMAKELGRQNAKVAILNRTQEKGQKVADEINNNNGEAVAIAANVLDVDTLIEAKKQILNRFGKIDILINGAGGNHEDAITSVEKHDSEETAEKSFFDLKEEGFTNVFDSNFKGSFLACKVFGEALLEQPGSTILNISSMSAYAPMTKVPAYSAAKAAINNFTMWLSVHFANTGLRVNAIAPGFFLTTQNENLLLDKEGNHTARAEKIINGTPMEKFGDPKDLIGTLLWLVDAEYSGFVTGVTVPVDGGFMAYSGV